MTLADYIAGAVLIVVVAGFVIESWIDRGQ